MNSNNAINLSKLTCSWFDEKSFVKSQFLEWDAPRSNKILYPYIYMRGSTPYRLIFKCFMHLHISKGAVFKKEKQNSKITSIDDGPNVT